MKILKMLKRLNRRTQRHKKSLSAVSRSTGLEKVMCISEKYKFSKFLKDLGLAKYELRNVTDYWLSLVDPEEGNDYSHLRICFDNNCDAFLDIFCHRGYPDEPDNYDMLKSYGIVDRRSHFKFESKNMEELQQHIEENYEKYGFIQM